MNADTSRSAGSPAFYLAIGFVIGAVVVGSSWFARGDTSPAHNTAQDVTVSYMYETNPGQASGNNNKPVQSIQFHPGYVVVTGESGRSDLFAVERLRKFSFSPTRNK